MRKSLQRVRAKKLAFNYSSAHTLVFIAGMLLVAALKYVTGHVCLHIHIQWYLWTWLGKEIHYSLTFKLSIRQSKELNLSVTSPLLKDMDSTNYLYNLLYFIVCYIWIVLKTSLRRCLIEYLGMYSSRNNHYPLFNSVGYPLCFTFHVFSHLFALVSVDYKFVWV